MKIMIISDIHGYSKNLKKVISVFNKEKCEKLIILGDLFYPGNDEEEVKRILNSMRNSILCMKGNNDRYIYPNELDFNIIDDYLNLKLDNHNVYITHGHKYNRNNCSFLKQNDILIQGHTHTVYLYRESNKYFVNPGSISLPRDNTDGSYVIYDDNNFYLYDIDGILLNCLYIE